MNTRQIDDLPQQEVRRTWHEASRRFFRPTPEEYEAMYRDKKRTALENLAARYRRFSTISMVMILCAFAWLWVNLPFSSERMRIITVVVMMVYFATCSAIDWWLYRGVSTIDCFTMSVKEVVDKALYYRRKHLQSIMFLIPFAICVVGVMAYALEEKFILIGMFAGGLVGLLAGYRQFTLFMKEYRTIAE